MKKNIIILIITILIIGVMAVPIVIYISNTSKLIPQNQLATTTNNETEDNQTEETTIIDNQNKKYESSNMQVIEASDENDMILLRDREKYNYHVATLSGKITAKNLDVGYGTPRIQNGYIFAGGKLLDRNGNKIYESERDIIAVSKNGYILDFDIEESMAKGTVKKYRIVDYKTGEVLKESETTIKYTGVEDYFTCDTAQFTSYTYNAKINDNGVFLNSNEEILSEKHKLIYNKMHQKIYDYDRNELKDISEGGADIVYCYGDRIFVKTGTGYVYTMDMNFNYVVQPAKIENFDFPDRLFDFGGPSINKFDEMMKAPTQSLGTMCFTKSGIYFIEIDLDSDDKNLYLGKLIVFDKDLKQVGEYEFKIDQEDDDAITLADNGLVVNSYDGNAYIYTENGVKELKDASIRVVTDTVINYNYNKNDYPAIFNLETFEEIKITE